MEDPLAPFLDIYMGEDRSWREARDNVPVVSSPSGCSPAAPPTFTEATGVQTRQHSNADTDYVSRPERNTERICHGLMIMLRLMDDPIACNKPCYILHLDFPDTVVAEEKSEGSWKART